MCLENGGVGYHGRFATAISSIRGAVERNPVEPGRVLSSIGLEEALGRRGGRVPASTPPPPPPCIISRCNRVPERYYGSRARGAAGRLYADGVGARSIIVRGMKHDGPPAIVRETHSREVGHGTTRGSQLHTLLPRHGTPPF